MYSLSGVSWGAFKDAEQNRDGYVAQCVVCVSVCVCARHSWCASSRHHLSLETHATWPSTAKTSQPPHSLDYLSGWQSNW